MPIGAAGETRLLLILTDANLIGLLFLLGIVGHRLRARPSRASCCRAWQGVSACCWHCSGSRSFRSRGRAWPCSGSGGAARGGGARARARGVRRRRHPGLRARRRSSCSACHGSAGEVNVPLVLTITAVLATRLLLVVQRSCSARQAPPDTGTPRWSARCGGPDPARGRTARSSSHGERWRAEPVEGFGPHVGGPGAVVLRSTGSPARRPGPPDARTRPRELRQPPHKEPDDVGIAVLVAVLISVRARLRVVGEGAARVRARRDLPARPAATASRRARASSS